MENLHQILALFYIFVPFLSNIGATVSFLRDFVELLSLVPNAMILRLMREKPVPLQDSAIPQILKELQVSKDEIPKENGPHIYISRVNIKTPAGVRIIIEKYIARLPEHSKNQNGNGKNDSAPPGETGDGTIFFGLKCVILTHAGLAS